MKSLVMFIEYKLDCSLKKFTSDIPIIRSSIEGVKGIVSHEFLSSDEQENQILEIICCSDIQTYETVKVLKESSQIPPVKGNVKIWLFKPLQV